MNHQRIAVIGSGISGLTVARMLKGPYEVTVFEAASEIGGHAHLIEVPNRDGEIVPVDAGVCMFYTTGYPNFFRLLRRLGIRSSPSDTTTEILCIPTGQRFHFELNAPWKTVASSVVHRQQRWLVSDGLRFYRSAMRAMRSESKETFSEHLQGETYSEAFRVFLSFLAGATWTLNQAAVGELPMGFVANTFLHLGFLPTLRHGAWHHIPGSVRCYLNALAIPLGDSVRLNHAVRSVERGANEVVIQGSHGEEAFCESFDEVVFAIPADNAVDCLIDPNELEMEILGAFRSQEHNLAFTSDEALTNSWTTNRPAIFAASDVNEQSMESGREFLFQVGFTDITKMCNYDLPKPIYMWYQFPDGPRPKNHVHAWHSFTTSRFSGDMLDAQRRHGEVSGFDRIHYCGAGWVNGIHEGSIVSALKVAKQFGKNLDSIQASRVDTTDGVRPKPETCSA